MKFNPQRPFPCVYWKHGAFWYVKRGKWESIGKTLEEASAEYFRRTQAAKEGKLPALIERTFIHHCATEKLAKNTRDQYRLAADTLKRRMKAFDSPAQVKSRHVAKIKVDGASTPNMTNRVISLLRTLFAYWVEWELADSNPCVGIKRHKEAKRERLITQDEWWAIYDKAGPRLKVIMKVAFLTGQRIGDVLGIRRNQLTTEGIEFKQQKTKKLLLVKWSPDIHNAVNEALTLHKGVPAMTLFLGRKGKPPNYRSVHLQWVNACEAAEVEDARPNDQRAQSATETKRQGKNATKLLGHSTEAMTNRYLRDRSPDVVEGPNLRQPLDVGQKGA